MGHTAETHAPQPKPLPGGERPYAHALAHDQRRARKPFTDRRFARSRSDRVLGGVCGGIAAFIGASSTNVRLIYALSVLLSVGTTAVGYLLLWLLIPAEPALTT
ncbi:MAG: PspC domain-containing protein [Trueperaceae bacterium]|jgi:phage shock protein PspC (stress-responsive transcriptional regulator)